MALRPSTQVIVVDNSPAKGASTDTSPGFVLGYAEKGSTTAAIEVSSMTEFEQKLGSRLSTATLYDALDAAFREGLPKAYVGRIVGPSAVKASAKLFDASGSTDPGDVALVATALDYGSWANGLNVEVVAGDTGGEFKIKVTHDTDATVQETSPSLVDRAAAVTWSTSSDYIVLSLGASNEDPRVQGPTSLASGTDDYSNASSTQRLAALALFVPELGPGQVSFPGATSSTIHDEIMDHAEANNRVALLDAADTGTKSTITSLAATLRALGSTNRKAMLLAPWVVVPGLTPGATRDVPPSAIALGIIGRNDSDGRSPNEPAANELGRSRYALGVKNTWSAIDRDELNTAGVAVLRDVLGEVRIMGGRTLADPTSDPYWLNFANSRMLMAIVAKLDAVANRYLFRQIDGKRLVISDFGGDLRAELLPFYNAGSLYGATPDEAFVVDVGPSVNTPATIADNQLNADVAVRLSPMGELITIRIAKVPVTEAL